MSSRQSFAKFPEEVSVVHAELSLLHHSRVHTNFCLFMLIYDYAYGTMDKTSEDFTSRLSRESESQNDAGCGVMAHGTELLSMFHLPFAFRSFSSRPFTTDSWLLKMLWPLTLPAVVA